jgi:L-lactate dehydrogenase complex protein LldE
VRIALFVTCVVDTLFPQAGRATVELLERLGHTVVFSPEQTCCGQVHANNGYPAESTRLLRRFVEIFGDAETIVTPSGSCAAMVREQYPHLAAASGDADLTAAVAALVPRVHELSELLIDVLGIEDVGACFPHRVTYHPSCHGLRTLGLGERPLRLLRAVREIELVELADADSCCGFGGTFAVKNADVSSAMLADKLHAVEQTGAEVCTAGDSSCLMHIGGGLERLRSGVRTMHLAEILASTEAAA